MAKASATQFLVIGIGRFGYAVAQKLFENDFDVLAVDNDMTNINHIIGHCTNAICMDATHEKALEKLGIANFDAVIVAMGTAEASIFVTLLCKQMGAKQLICRAINENHRIVLEKIGADAIIFPEEEAGLKLASVLSNPNMLEILELSENFTLMEIRTPPKWANKTLMQLDVRRLYKINIIVVKRNNEIIPSPGGDFALLAGDLLIIGGENEALKKMKNMATEQVNDIVDLLE